MQSDHTLLHGGGVLQIKTRSPCLFILILCSECILLLLMDLLILIWISLTFPIFFFISGYHPSNENESSSGYHTRSGGESSVPPSVCQNTETSKMADYTGKTTNMYLSIDSPKRATMSKSCEASLNGSVDSGRPSSFHIPDMATVTKNGVKGQ